MGRRSQELMTGKTYVERVARRGSLFSRAIRALKKVGRERTRNKPHLYGIGNLSRDGIPKDMRGMPAISLKKEVK